jgi:hypothetical membrane protein
MALQNQRIAGVTLFLGATGFLLAMNLAEWLYPGYSVSQNTISDLGATCNSGVCAIHQPTSIIFNSSVFILGVLIIVGAFFLYRAHKKKAFSILLILSGIGAMGVGLFPETFGIIHGIASLVVFLFGGLAAVASIQILKRPFSYFSIILGLITLSSLVLYTSGIFLGLGVGGMERLVAYPALLWGVGLGGYLLSIQEIAQSAPAAKT